MFLDFPSGLDGKESACNVGHLGLIPGLRRSPRVGNGTILQYSWLENSMDRGGWQTTDHEVEKESDMTECRCMHAFKVVTVINSDLGSFQILKRM